MCHKYNRAKAENASDLTNLQQKYDEHMSLKEQSRKGKEQDKVRANEDALTLLRSTYKKFCTCRLVTFLYFTTCEN